MGDPPLWQAGRAARCPRRRTCSDMERGNLKRMRAGDLAVGDGVVVAEDIEREGIVTVAGVVAMAVDRAVGDIDVVCVCVLFVHTGL